MPHVPVMLETCLTELELCAGQTYVDATFGAGGHTRAMLARGAKVIAIDQDPEVQRYLDELATEDLTFVKGNFADLRTHLQSLGISQVDGILMDLGVSSMQLNEAERGFSFRQEAPLDMRMSRSGESAADIVNQYTQEDLARIIYKYGEDRYSRRIARAIVEARQKTPIITTLDLSQIIQSVYPPGGRLDHPARRTFQALRIVVNGELEALESALEDTALCLASGGRLVVLSYHSLEDRIVKHFVKEHHVLEAKQKRPLQASQEEIQGNPRARSAKLRSAIKRGGAE